MAFGQESKEVHESAIFGHCARPSSLSIRIHEILYKNPRKSSKFLDLRVSSPPQYLADQLTLFQPWGQILLTTLLLAPKFFSPFGITALGSSVGKKDEEFLYDRVFDF